MPLNNVPILVVCDDAETATALVEAITAARGDVVYAVNVTEAIQRVRQFDVAAAVLAWHVGEDATVAALQEKGVPFCLFKPSPVLATPHADVPAASTVDQVASVLAAMLAR